MLYRIDWEETSYEGAGQFRTFIIHEYLFGARALARAMSSDIVWEGAKIVYCKKVKFSFRALKVCLRHDVSRNYMISHSV